MTLDELNSHKSLIDLFRAENWVANIKSWQHPDDGTVYAWELISPRGQVCHCHDPFTEESVRGREAWLYANRVYHDTIDEAYTHSMSELLGEIAKICEIQLRSPGKGLEIPDQITVKEIVVNLRRQEGGK